MRISLRTALPALVAVAGLAIATPAMGQLPGAEAIVNSINGKLAKYEMKGFVNWWHVPGKMVGGKFRAGEVMVDGKKVRLKTWVKDLVPVISGMADKAPSGYVLQITGHANKPPRTSERALVRLSARRAAYVHKLFKSLGMTTDKVTNKGVGTAEMGSGDNRRVTFKLVKSN